MADKKLYPGLVITNAAGSYLVLKERDSGKFRLVNLHEGFIYSKEGYDNRFIEEHRKETSTTSREFNMCEVIKKVNGHV